MKTIAQWLDDNLNFDDFTKAMVYHKDTWNRTTVNEFKDALSLAFDWSHSHEGAKYWSIIARNGGSLEIPKKVDDFLEAYMGKVTPDKVVRSVMKDLNERSNLGVNKYGTTLDRDDLNTSDWARHLYEELLDASLYIKKLINKLNERK